MMRQWLLAIQRRCGEGGYYAGQRTLQSRSFLVAVFGTWVVAFALRMRSGSSEEEEEDDAEGVHSCSLQLSTRGALSEGGVDLEATLYYGTGAGKSLWATCVTLSNQKHVRVGMGFQDRSGSIHRM